MASHPLILYILFLIIRFSALGHTAGFFLSVVQVDHPTMIMTYWEGGGYPVANWRAAMILDMLREGKNMKLEVLAPLRCA